MAKRTIKQSKVEATSHPQHRPRKSSDIPATSGMLDNVRSELKYDLTSVKLEVKSLKLEVKSLDKKMDAGFAKVLSQVHRIGLLVEEQNARNKFALDGYASLSDRFDQFRVDILKEIV